MGNICCVKPDDFETKSFDEFWNIKIKTKTMSNLITYIKANHQKNEETYSPTLIKDLITEYLTPLRSKYDSFYENFWNQVFKGATAYDNKLFELTMSLVFLTIKDSEHIKESIYEVFSIFPMTSANKRLIDVLNYYFNLITNYSISEIGKIYNICKDDIQLLYNKYDNHIINLYINELEGIYKFNMNELAFDNIKFFEDSCHVICDDSLVRDNLYIIYRKNEMNQSRLNGIDLN